MRLATTQREAAVMQQLHGTRQLRREKAERVLADSVRERTTCELALQRLRNNRMQERQQAQVQRQQRIGQLLSGDGSAKIVVGGDEYHALREQLVNQKIQAASERLAQADQQVQQAQRELNRVVRQLEKSGQAKTALDRQLARRREMRAEDAADDRPAAQRAL